MPAERMLEPDVTLTDLVLAVQCAAFAIILLRRNGESPKVVRLFAFLFATLSFSSLSGAIWHGVYSASDTSLGHLVWLLTMAALAVVAALLWLISGQLLASSKWARRARVIAYVQLGPQLIVSALVTDSFAVAAVGLLPPLATVFAICLALSWTTRTTGAACGSFGFALAGLAGLVIAFDVSLNPTWATTLTVYHMVQFVAFWLVFWSVPTLASTIEDRENRCV